MGKSAQISCNRFLHFYTTCSQSHIFSCLIFNTITLWNALQKNSFAKIFFCKQDKPKVEHRGELGILEICVCVCVQERERERDRVLKEKIMCMRMRDRVREYLCVWERERERERERGRERE